MKIKHFQGYGCVNARKIYKGKDILVVEVRGEHEYGLALDDKYDVFNWLVKRFDKSHKDWIEIVDLKVDDRYEEKSGTYTGYEEIVTYTIRFNDKNHYGF